jgi:hypothetical protein
MMMEKIKASKGAWRKGQGFKDSGLRIEE